MKDGEKEDRSKHGKWIGKAVDVREMSEVGRVCKVNWN